jgi:hypothetical protein
VATALQRVLALAYVKPYSRVEGQSEQHVGGYFHAPGSGGAQMPGGGSVPKMGGESHPAGTQATPGPVMRQAVQRLQQMHSSMQSGAARPGQQPASQSPHQEIAQMGADMSSRGSQFTPESLVSTQRSSVQRQVSQGNAAVSAHEPGTGHQVTMSHGAASELLRRTSSGAQGQRSSGQSAGKSAGKQGAQQGGGHGMAGKMAQRAGRREAIRYGRRKLTGF